MTPFEFGQFAYVALYKSAADYYPPSANNEFDDDIAEEIAQVKRMGNTVPQKPMLSGTPGVTLSAGRTVNGRPAPVVPGRAGVPAQTKPAVRPPARPVAPAPARRLPTLPKGPTASRDFGGSVE